MRPAKYFRMLAMGAASCLTMAALAAALSLQGMAGTTQQKGKPVSGDEFSFLEDAHGDRALAWAKLHTERTVAQLQSDPRFDEYYRIARANEEAADSSDAHGLIATSGFTSLQHGWFYQVKSDASHPRGVWRRARLDQIVAGHPAWQELIDLDALEKREQREWVLHGSLVSPNGRRAMLHLTFKGGLTHEWREYDLERNEFVADGFRTPLSTSTFVGWRGDDMLLVSGRMGDDLAKGEKTAFSVRLWARKQSLTAAKEIFRGEADDIGVIAQEDGQTINRTDRNRVDTWWLVDALGTVRKMAVPAGAVPLRYRASYVMQTNKDWSIGSSAWKAGSVLAIPVSEIVKPLPRVELVFEPDRDTAVSNVIGRTKLGLLFSGHTVGNGRAWHARFESGRWRVAPIGLPDHGLIMPVGVDPHSDIALVLYQSFLQPGTLYSVNLAHGRATEIARRAAAFDSTEFVTEQLDAKSKDGASVPYFLVRPRALRFDGQAPTWVQGYGAFGAPVLPFYSATIGNLWLERGGVYVLAAVRGGSDRGRDWYVTRTDRQHTYDDAIAVVEDLIRRKVTSVKRVGFEGWSAGGLLAGVMLTQRPDLFGAVLLKAPVLDEFRLDLGALGPDFYKHEYGSPDIPEERAFLERTSPFQNLRKVANFPKPLLLTSTTDETVHPAQPRRFAAKMESLGLPFFFYESSEGGHAIASTPEQRAQLDALVYTYFARQIMEPGSFNTPDDRGERAGSSGPELRD